MQSEGICMFFVENWECFQLVVPQPKQITPENERSDQVSKDTVVLHWWASKTR